MRQVNVEGMIHATRAVMGGMWARRYGRIVGDGTETVATWGHSEVDPQARRWDRASCDVRQNFEPPSASGQEFIRRLPIRSVFRRYDNRL